MTREEQIKELKRLIQYYKEQIERCYNIGESAEWEMEEYEQWLYTCKEDLKKLEEQ